MRINPHGSACRLPTDAHLCHLIQSSPQKKTRQRAWMQLLEKHKGLIAKLAKKYLCEGVEMRDMYQEATIGFRYSALSYDQDKAKFTTHAGWGIMKYCMMLRDNVQKHTRENNISQNKAANETYNLATINHHHETTVSAAKFRKIRKQAKLLNMPTEDILTLALAYHQGTEEQRKRWKRRLFHHWLQRNIEQVSKRMVSKLEKLQKPEDQLF